MAKRAERQIDDYRTYFAGNSTWFKHIDIEGDEMVVTIASVEPGKIGEGQKERDQAVITFEGVDKKFGCNRTNADTIAGLYGSNPRHWVGKAITLFRTTTEMNRKIVECVRIRDYPPAGAKRAPKSKAIPIKGKIR